MRKIVVPVDFSENSWNALKCAIQYFKYEKSDFYIFHSYANEVYKNAGTASEELLKEQIKVQSEKAEKGLANFLKRIQDYYPDPKHKYITKAVFGNLLDEVNDFVELENIDLIVMGTKGKTNDSTITYGSHTLQILKYVKCPVLGIPAAYTYERPTNIVFPSDFMIPCKKREMKLLSCLAKSYRSTIHLLYLSDYERLSSRQRDNKELIELCLEENSVQYARRDYGPITKLINQYITDEGIDLVVMVNSRHSYMEELLNQSNIDAISLNTNIPLLVFQNLIR